MSGIVRGTESVMALEGGLDALAGTNTLGRRPIRTGNLTRVHRQMCMIEY